MVRKTSGLKWANLLPFNRCKTPPEGPCLSYSPPFQDLEDGLMPRVRASKLEYKEVDEVWNAKEYRYEIIDAEPTNIVAKLEEYVFVVRKRVDRYPFEPLIHIDINSEGLRDILRTTLGKVKGLDLRKDTLSIERNVLFHFLDELKAHHGQYELSLQNEASCHLGLLLDYMNVTYESTKAHLTELLKHKEITYDLLWALFPPNTLVYTTCHGTKKPQCVQYGFGQEEELGNGTVYFNLECRYLDFDGQVLGDVSTELAILKFRGTVRISDLSAFPLQYHPKEPYITAQLVKCGRKFISLRDAHHLYCHGIAFFMEDSRPYRMTVNSRVMIDAKLFHEMNPDYARPKVVESQMLRSELSELGEDDLLICCPSVPGFSLGDKVWLRFAVADIEDIKWSSTAFDSLTITQERKEVILAMAKARGQVSNCRFDDVIAGKGQGLNILLHGPPGVGKTLTAEAVAEHLHRPLYSISAGELEVDAAKLEKRLSTILEVAQHWGAIVLLDEADVFLEKRSSNHLLRNSLVAVFLRRLEYYKGILFLTTNRISEFDHAILSRLHLALKYNNLRREERKAVWENLLRRAGVSIGSKELNFLANGDLNGRQIKNVVGAADALATQDDVAMTFKHIEYARSVSEEFIKEFYGLPERLYN